MSPKPRRRWYQFSLITLLIGLTLFSLPLGYIAWEREQCRRGEAALAFLRRNSDSEAAYLARFGNDLDGRPAWLRSILGDDEFRRVDHAFLGGNSVVDSDLFELSKLPNLGAISINSAPNVTDDGVANLRRPKMVQVFLFTNNQKVSGENWEVLSSWQSLWKLSFEGTHFENGILELPVLEKLSYLSLKDTNCTDAVMERIVMLKNLDSLFLSNTQISNGSIDRLSQLPKLEFLMLENTKVTNSGFQQLRIALPNTQVIDESEQK